MGTQDSGSDKTQGTWNLKSLTTNKTAAIARSLPR